LNKYTKEVNMENIQKEKVPEGTFKDRLLAIEKRLDKIEKWIDKPTFKITSESLEESRKKLEELGILHKITYEDFGF